MKKIILALVILVANISLIACTDDSLTETQEDINTAQYTDSDDDHIDPPEDPPSDGE